MLLRQASRPQGPSTLGLHFQTALCRMELDSMISQAFAPHRLLAPYVKLIWLFELDAPDFNPVLQRIVSDGIVEAVFHFAEPFETSYDGLTFSRQPESFLISQTQRAIQIRPTGRSGFVSIRFFPWGAYHFFAPPVISFADRLAVGQEVWGDGVTAVEEALSLASDHRTRLEIVQDFLFARLARFHKEEVAGLIDPIWRNRGQISANSLSQTTGLTERTLQRRFEKALGASPKHFACLTRFLHACRVLREKKWEILADVAHACGYYDQSHFCDEFRRFAGVTPREFLADSSISFLRID